MRPGSPTSPRKPWKYINIFNLKKCLCILTQGITHITDIPQVLDVLLYQEILEDPRDRNNEVNIVSVCLSTNVTNK